MATSSHAQPSLEIAANTYLHERVYTFPDAIDLGAISISQIRKNPSLLGMLTRTLMVYQEDGTDFRASLRSDSSILKVGWERGPKGDRYQATLSIDPDLAAVGIYDHPLLIDTNDPAFPRLTVPIAYRILE